MKELTSQVQKAFDWVFKENGVGFLLSDEHCPTSDVFQARLGRFSNTLETAGVVGDVFGLLVAIVGEIGNNAFDHNFGNWFDELGIYFVYDLNAREIVIADRGQGVRASLQNVRSNIADDCEALSVAFTEILSGRAPEKRGNGLKFTREQIHANHWDLEFFSGNARYHINEDDSCVMNDKNIRGVVAVIHF